jgi:UDPglucose 6-dehydrogenase
MHIGVIGAGFVGFAVINAHINDQVVVRDPKISKSADLNEFADCQAIYICVPSPSKGHGHCDTSILESVLDELHTLGFNNIPLISKVTAPPSAYEELQKLYPNLVYAPEFLTARNSIIDYKYSQLAIVGGQQLWANAAAEIIVRGLDSICK